MVGASTKADQASNAIANYLRAQGYNVIPVNPNYDEVLGMKCYPDLKSVPEHIDIVDIFRKPEAISEIVDEAIQVKAGTIWMQLKLRDKFSAQKAQEAAPGLLQDVLWRHGNFRRAPGNEVRRGILRAGKCPLRNRLSFLPG